MSKHPNFEKSRQKLRPWVSALSNPHLLISFGIAWFLTNGWAYCAAGAGAYFHIGWLAYIGTAWLGILWFPCTPEKILTFALAVLILRMLFPQDTRTLALIRRKSRELREKTMLEFARFRAWMHGRR